METVLLMVWVLLAIVFGAELFGSRFFVGTKNRVPMLCGTIACTAGSLAMAVQKCMILSAGAAPGGLLAFGILAVLSGVALRFYGRLS